LRAVRKSHNLRLDDLAGCAGVGHVFARDVEHGKETVQLGRVLKLLSEAGIHLKLDFTESALPELERLRKEGLRPLKPRSPRKASTANAAEAVLAQA
jgi:transcriptional regulator with XRE-family HTH domain